MEMVKGLTEKVLSADRTYQMVMMVNTCLNEIVNSGNMKMNMNMK